MLIYRFQSVSLTIGRLAACVGVMTLTGNFAFAKIRETSISRCIHMYMLTDTLS